MSEEDRKKIKIFLMFPIAYAFITFTEFFVSLFHFIKSFDNLNA